MIYKTYFSIFASLSLSLSAYNQNTWVESGLNGSWTNPSSWSLNQVPTDAEQAVFSGASVTTIIGLTGNLNADSIFVESPATDVSLFDSGSALLQLHGTTPFIIDSVAKKFINNIEIELINTGSPSPPKTFEISSGVLSNTGTITGSTSDVIITGPGLFENDGDFYYFKSIKIDGNVVSKGKSFGADLLEGMTIKGGTFSFDGTVGPLALNMNQGALQGNGLLILSGQSQITGGTVHDISIEVSNPFGTSSLIATIPLGNGNTIITVGDKLGTEPENQLILNVPQSGIIECTVLRTGGLIGSTFIGNLNLSGLVWPGGTSGIASIKSKNATLDTNPYLFFNIDGLQCSTFSAGVLNCKTPTTAIYGFHIKNPPSGENQYILGTFSSLTSGSITTGTIFAFDQNFNQLDVSNYQVFYDSINQQLILNVNFSKIDFPVIPGNGGVTATLLNQLNGNCSPELQNTINKIGSFNFNDQTESLDELSPQFKIAQFSSEKLQFAIHKDLKNSIYHYQRGIRPFLLVGYDNLHQKGNHLYTGYNVNSFYQIAGVSYGMNHGKVMGGIGASESYLKTTFYRSTVDTNTIYLTFGGSYRLQKWRFGAESLFGYNFLNTTRNIPSLGFQEQSDHGGWNLSFESHISYKMHDALLTFEPYNDLGYIYGIENDYLETGPGAVALSVIDESISMLRNALGFKIDVPRNKSFKYFLDLAWVYEHYLNDNNYKAAFTGTHLYGTYKQLIPQENYLRFNAGLLGRHKKIEWQLSYLGLYGTRFSENTASFKISNRF